MNGGNLRGLCLAMAILRLERRHVHHLLTIMFTRRTILALAQTRLQLNRTVLSVPSYIPAHLLRPSAPFRAPLSRLQGGQRQFSASSPLQVQYTRFSNGYTYHGRRPDRDKVTKVLVFVTAAGVVYYVAQYVDTLGHARAVDELHLPLIVSSKCRKRADGGLWT